MTIDPIYGVPEELVHDRMQSMIELVYVKQANDVLSEKMGEMENALTVTKHVMDTLTTLQTAHNQVTVESRDIGNFNYDETIDGDDAEVEDYVGDYTDFASEAFGKPLRPTFIYTGPSSPGFSDYQADLLTTKSQLTSQIDELSEITPTLANGDVDPNSLLAKLKKVLDDLNKYDINTFTGVRDWALDNYNSQTTSSSSKAGAIQQNITAAITAGQSLNDTQKETVRQFLYVFEEYYKSASAILTKITQIIEKMAQGISR